MKPKYHILISIIALACLLGLAYAKKAEVTRSIRWSERLLTWDDFPIVESISGDYHAMVYSDIQFEGNREDNSLRIYAQMLPHQSGRVPLHETKSEQLLIHEQNHFNITEYHARLFRKEAIAVGKEELTNDDLQRLGKKYLKRIALMQTMYDKESDHNLNMTKQRYWELYIAGLLRETAYYSEEDIYQYQEFTKGNTHWFRKVYVTLQGELLTSYPENNKNSIYGEVYKVKKSKDSIVVSFYKNGKPTTGGYFESPICIMTYPNEKVLEQHFLDADGAYYLSKATPPIIRIQWDSNDNITHTYFNEKRGRISHKGVFTKKGKWDAKQQSYYFSYYNDSEEQITYDNAFYELREIGDNKVTKRISYFENEGKPTYDSNFISIYEYETDNNFTISRAKYYDKEGKLAVFKDGYHTVYEYNERGKIVSVSYHDRRGDNIADINGIHKYTYAYDIYDNETDMRKFNTRQLASNGEDEYHHAVNLYDSLGRIRFAAKYHPDYILKFSEEKEGALVYEYLGDSIIKIKNEDVFGIETNNNSGVCLTKKKLNSKKEVLTTQFYNADGYWAKTPDSVASYTYKYDKRGNQIEMTALDSLGKPQNWTDDVATTRWEYDERNNKIKTTYFTSENELANATQGTTYNIFKYDKNDVIIETSYYDKAMKPTLFDGAHKKTYLFNQFGRDSIIKKYDTANRLIKGTGNTKYLYTYHGFAISEAYFDENDTPILNSDGVHKIVYNYDKNWRYIGDSFKGKYGESVNDNRGISNIVFTLNPSGYLWILSYGDKNKKEVIGPEGFHSMYNHYNDMDVVQRTSFFGADKKLINDEDGIADYVYSINSSGQTTRISFYDADSNLTEDSEGVAEYYYDSSLNGLYYLDKKLNAQGEELP